MKKKGEKKTFYLCEKEKKFLKWREKVKRIRTESELFFFAGYVCCLKDTK